MDGIEGQLPVYLAPRDEAPWKQLIDPPTGKPGKFGNIFAEESDKEEKNYEKVTADTKGLPLDQEPKGLNKAGSMMEAHFVKMMLKTMDEASGEGGILKSDYQGMSYFKDMFFNQVSEDIVKQKGLGFASNLSEVYGNQ